CAFIYYYGSTYWYFNVW
nr:immunoglobulin heavy chain junction region [Mus musculus]MBK4187318.1 immunoglobulin heavy chain junction region [Mus musculus]